VYPVLASRFASDWPSKVQVTAAITPLPRAPGCLAPLPSHDKISIPRAAFCAAQQPRPIQHRHSRAVLRDLGSDRGLGAGVSAAIRSTPLLPPKPLRVQRRYFMAADRVTTDDNAKSDAGSEVTLLASGIEGAEHRLRKICGLCHCRRTHKR